MSSHSIEDALLEAFRTRGLSPTRVTVRSYPNEVTALAFFGPHEVERAIGVSEQVETELAGLNEDLLVVVRRDRETRVATATSKPDLNSPAALALQQLISARNRVSDVQPSLSYVKDLAENIATMATPRHHLVFGRRGAGKSSLLVESKRNVELDDAVTSWTNLQTLRRDEPSRIFVRVARGMIGEVLSRLNAENQRSRAVTEATRLFDRLSDLSQDDDLTQRDAERIVPDVQESLRRCLALLDTELFVFVDDFYYVPRSQQPLLLDMLHGCVRDCRAWLKVASIRHLTRWFVSSPPLGLQTGHDADVIDLDVTLEDPQRVRRFLVEILERYAAESGVDRLSRVFRREAIDRLVLASGGVPRDFLVLTAAAITKARARENARNVGVQDVNQVAGEAATEKISELEEDLAANEGHAGTTLQALSEMRRFCLEAKSSTYFRVDLFDKETSASEYQILADLLDLRLVHLIHGSVSDAHEAGRRFEVFMLDLSQFSGSRLKQGLRVLDLQGEALVAKQTRTKAKTRKADRPLELIAIMRAAPLFELELLTPLAAVN